MYHLYLEVACPKHGLERYKIKVIRKYNIPSEFFGVRYGKRKKNLNAFIVGRNVNEKEILKRATEHFKRTGLWQRIIIMRLESL